MNEIIRNMLTRRSVRRYTATQVEEGVLTQVLQSAQYAPTGSNSQSWQFTVLQSREILAELNDRIREAFAETAVDEKTYVSIRGGKEASKREDYAFHYNAPTLVIVSNRADYPNAMADSACALENMQLAAHALGLGSCWINQLTWFGERPAVRAVLERIGLPVDHKVCGSLAIGVPVEPISPPLPRKGDPVVWVR